MTLGTTGPQKQPAEEAGPRYWENWGSRWRGIACGYKETGLRPRVQPALTTHVYHLYVCVHVFRSILAFGVDMKVRG